ncbi:hypothetical protein VTK73DRAFT_5202 [Phialemonium thermophilum]|uniref:Uncharacterized protein n=1 Tax=Phialemonium thermophilum TaxID=223376 RepID=A0ABR3V311_9PEZI
MATQKRRESLLPHSREIALAGRLSHLHGTAFASRLLITQNVRRPPTDLHVYQLVAIHRSWFGSVLFVEARIMGVRDLSSWLPLHSASTSYALFRDVWCKAQPPGRAACWPFRPLSPPPHPPRPPRPPPPALGNSRFAMSPSGDPRRDPRSAYPPSPRQPG